VQEKLIIAVMVAFAVLLVLLGGNVMEKQRVTTALNEIFSPSNTHTFKDRTGVENEIWNRVEGVVGTDAEVEVEIYHYQGSIRIDEFDGELPRYGGVRREGGNINLSAVMCRVWWTQTMLGKNPKDVFVVKTLFVQPNVMGGAYTPPPKDFAEVQDPVMMLEAAR
jgi:hypothetical protein